MPPTSRSLSESPSLTKDCPCRPTVDLATHPLTTGTGRSACPISRRIGDDDFGPVFDAALDGARGRDRGDRRQSRDADDRQHACGAGTRRRGARPRLVDLLVPGRRPHQRRDPGDGARDLAEDVAAFLGDLDEREAVCPHRRSLCSAAPRSASTPRRCGVLEKTWKGFVRSGAKLDAGRQEAAGGDQRGAVLARHDIRPERARRREGLGAVPRRGRPRRPARIPEERDGARRPRARGQKGRYAVTLSRSIYEPFTTFSERRDLREKAFRAFIGRGENGGATDNREVVKRDAARCAPRRRSCSATQSMPR